VRWCADGDFWRLFASCICSEPCAASFRPASEIRTKATPSVEVWQTSNLRRLKLGEVRKKDEGRKKKPQDKNIMDSALFHRATIKSLDVARRQPTSLILKTIPPTRSNGNVQNERATSLSY